MDTSDAATIAKVAIYDFAIALMGVATDNKHYGDLDCHDISTVAKRFGVDVAVRNIRAESPQQQTRR